MTEFNRYTCGLTETVTTEYPVTAKNRDGAALLFREATGKWPQWVGEDQVLGICEQCSKPVFEDQPGSAFADGVILHQACEAEVPS